MALGSEPVEEKDRTQEWVRGYQNGYQAGTLASYWCFMVHLHGLFPLPQVGPLWKSISVCCITISSEIKISHTVGSFLGRKVNNSKWLQEVPETDKIH